MRALSCCRVVERNDRASAGRRRRRQRRKPVIRSQEQAFARDDAGRWPIPTRRPRFTRCFPTPTCSVVVRRGYAPVYRHKSVEFGEGRAANGKIAQDRAHSSMRRQSVGRAVHPRAAAGRQLEDHRLRAEGGRAVGLVRRHCEERSDEAIPVFACGSGLLPPSRKGASAG